MASIGKLPIYMRIGSSAEVHIGDFAPTVNPLGIAAEFTRADLAAMFRSAADSLDPPKGADTEG
jgi:hypothetical protein